MSENPTMTNGKTLNSIEYAGLWATTGSN